MLVGNLNYAGRVKGLHASGKALEPGALAALAITEYAHSGETFEALAALQLAKGARAAGVALPFTSHPSLIVRRMAVSSGLLSGEEARGLLLSQDSSRSLRALLVTTCTSLPVDAETFGAALRNHGPFTGSMPLQ